jgi:nucleoside-diphosphate-sugar epimerase
MKFKKILITGSAGLLGRHVVRELMPHSHVIGFDLKKSNESIE